MQFKINVYWVHCTIPYESSAPYLGAMHPMSLLMLTQSPALVTTTYASLLFMSLDVTSGSVDSHSILFRSKSARHLPRVRNLQRLAAAKEGKDPRHSGRWLTATTTAIAETLGHIKAIPYHLL